MKKLRKKNQLILTLLAVMIAVAGYLTYLPKQEDQTVPALENQGKTALMDISDEDILAENIALEQAQFTGTKVDSEKAEDETAVVGKDGEKAGENESDEGETQTNGEKIANGETQESISGQPGEAVLTWSQQVENRMAEAQLSRDQVRTRNEETLNRIIENSNLSEAQRKTAADNLMTMTKNSSKEADIESILETKGLPQTLVTISETGVEVLVGSSSLTDAQRAQIEDTVKREANIEISDLVISLMNPVNTEVVEEP